MAPELTLSRLMTLQRESLERLDLASSAFAAALTPAWTAGRTHADPLDYIQVLRDPKANAERFATFQEQAPPRTRSRPPALDGGRGSTQREGGAVPGEYRRRA
ncbi:hypothetical protein [Streptomyces sp. NPDC048272]|uniref:hypothetical protein n=1 Tax=Streptomyces sp. NPDC048272 TaxID=3154616 RepID=UPI0034275FB3